METELRKQRRKIILIGLAVFLVFNAFSWTPGYGGRRDHEPGAILERYFGWPACFYCDLWRSEGSPTVKELNFTNYFFLVPFLRDMERRYGVFGLLPLLLNCLLVAVGTGACLVLVQAEIRRELSPRMGLLCGVLVAIGLAIISFADETSVYL